MERRFIVVTVLISVIFLVLEFANARTDFWDFRVYYDAANELLIGGVPYGKSFGLSSGFYKYSPVSLFLFIPFAILPYGIASIFFYCLIVFSFILLMLKIHHFLLRFIIPTTKKKYLTFLIVSVIVSAHIIRELHLGNVNLFLLLLFWFAFENISKKKKFLAGFLITIGIFIKPHFIVLLPLLVLKANWKAITSIIISSGILLFTPSIFFGIEKNKSLLYNWFETMGTHNYELSKSTNTIYGLFNNYVLSPLEITSDNVLVMTGLSVVSIFIFIIIHYNKLVVKPNDNEIFFTNYLEYFLIIALIPNITHTDTEHFLWSLPIVMLLVYFIMQIANIRKRIFISVFTIIIALPWYINSPDIIPDSWVVFLNQGGYLGLSNLFIIGMAIYLFYQRKKITLVN